MDRHLVEFIDTSVLLEILNVPGKSSQHARIRDAVVAKQGRVTMILPTAAVIETGNHICGLPNGHDRRDRAAKFSTLLDLSAREVAPWRLHQATWDGRLLALLCQGAGTGSDLVEHATSKSLGAGDLSILAEMEIYRRNVSTEALTVHVWTLDEKLRSYGG